MFRAGWAGKGCLIVNVALSDAQSRENVQFRCPHSPSLYKPAASPVRPDYLSCQTLPSVWQETADFLGMDRCREIWFLTPWSAPLFIVPPALDSFRFFRRAGPARRHRSQLDPGNGFGSGGLRPPPASVPSAPVPGPAIRARSCAGCTPARHNPRSAAGWPTPHPGTG